MKTDEHGWLNPMNLLRIISSVFISVHPWLIQNRRRAVIVTVRMAAVASGRP